MENPEEILQALNEFQKLRPTEIPRELEEYLCWVAKTGDPVYQWPLIKVLFREKLARVMTDFYESCPSLELAPCPNVEHFNYDTMKSNLLERLESFANAPFTVQRICELLTAPRKEYNRVDKFMRAIEKNILVVSTREPGSAARRSENGEGMVNGSMEDDTSGPQPSHDIEMESWVKDCPPATTITVHTVENDSQLIETVMPSTTIVKNLPAADEDLQISLDKSEQHTSPRSEISASNFIPSISEFSGVVNLTSQIQSQDMTVPTDAQNLSTLVHETPGIVGDVPEAIMNEDTSSQPSLDLENDDTESADNTRKLQTTFQARDFVTSDAKLTKFYSESTKLSDKLSTVSEVTDGVEKASTPNENQKKLVETNLESKSSLNNEESVLPAAENLLQTNEKVESKTVISQTIESTKVSVEGSTLIRQENLTLIAGSTSLENTIPSMNTVEELKTTTCKLNENVTIVTTSTINTSSSCISETRSKIEVTQSITTLKESTSTLEDSLLVAERLQKANKESETMIENSKAIIEEPSTEESNTVINENQKISSSATQDGLTIEETVEDCDSKVATSIIPDPIPIVEEPKDVEPIISKDNTGLIEEITSDSKDQMLDTEQLSPNKVKQIKVESVDSVTLEGSQAATTIQLGESQSSTIECTNSVGGEFKQAESMEVDNEESVLVFQQDEPMEQELAEPMKS